MRAYQVFDTIYYDKTNDQFYYKYYNSNLPITAATLYNLSDHDFLKYIRDGYRLLHLERGPILVKYIL